MFAHDRRRASSTAHHAAACTTLPMPAEHVPTATAVGRASSCSCTRFASGGAAMTGVEAISNGVPAFKPPEWKNARSTLMVMGVCLGLDVHRHLVAGHEDARRPERARPR